MTVRVLCL